MIEKLKKNDPKAYGKLTDAIVLITILVAGADGKIDFKEAGWAEKLTEIRSFSLNKDLRGMYKDVGADFNNRFDFFIETLPVGLEKRNIEIGDKLSMLNDILPLLGEEIAAKVYQDFISFAEHVAKTSGGFLGFLTISRAEENVMKLTMINEFK